MTKTIELALSAGWPEIALRMASKDELEKLEAFAELVRADERARLLAVAGEPDHWMRNGYASFESHPDAVPCFTADQVAAAVLREREEIRLALTRIVIVPTLTHGTLVKLSDVDAAIRARGPIMTKEEMLRIMRLLSAIESAMIVSRDRIPDYLHDEIVYIVGRLETEILK